MSDPEEMVPDPEPQTAMMLTQIEWNLLADICKSFFAQTPQLPKMLPDHYKIAQRIIEAS